MITFTSISSSSAGNAYLVESNGFMAPLLVEAGLPIRSLREKLNFGLAGLAGCICSHEHMDHAKAIKDLLKAGVECFLSSGTAGALGVTLHHRINILRSGVPRSIVSRSWSVLPFPLEHDAAEPTGFFISDGDDNLLFVPDTAYVHNRFDGITIAAVECNHIEAILAENIRNGSVDQSLGHRIRRNHMSLETAIGMMKANDLSKCRAIHLIHLSNANSNEVIMKREMEAATGIPVTIC